MFLKNFTDVTILIFSLRHFGHLSHNGNKTRRNGSLYFRKL